ncbi:cytochrome b [Rheinheimera aquimaris]|jgi:cytochrome b561|uniref:cytochrome b n=1 Tax=Rheinheimera aquimaris TaxID=412437 RepID=UPI00106622FD|nr:cytochrome b [Rheinheimera aquimaris]
MGFKNTKERYNRLSITLHWLMVLLIAAVYAVIELKGIYPRGSEPREAMKMLHFMLGLSVLLLVLIRIFVRFSSGKAPVITPAIANWQAMLAKVVHLALYALMLGLPIAGWFILSLSGKPIPFFGLELPALAAENKELAKTVKEIHETAGKVGYALIGLHAVAALFHHYIRRDSTLKRMLPGK